MLLSLGKAYPDRSEFRQGAAHQSVGDRFERVLASHYGGEYEKYRKKVRRYL